MKNPLRRKLLLISTGLSLQMLWIKSWRSAGTLESEVNNNTDSYQVRLSVRYIFKKPMNKKTFFEFHQTWQRSNALFEINNKFIENRKLVKKLFSYYFVGCASHYYFNSGESLLSWLKEIESTNAIDIEQRNLYVKTISAKTVFYKT